ncbi:DEAD/DEAH box helicase [Nocardioides dongxiaopingii]|uniref:DEAD/DEAH box helicase n=1 Tax=Nocardioides dongxiaopingii TaxID=2576036 RepID=UPI0010C7674B|nr:DEAD/DEAH box helicase [Nocardioides dongxiaopingii]
MSSFEESISQSDDTSALTVQRLHRDLADDFVRFYNTAYELREQPVSDEREALLRRSGVALAEPYLEVMPEYSPSTETLSQTLSTLRADHALGLLQAGVMPRERPYQHQSAALTASLAGRDVIVGTGTGSGKTEAFLLPVITRIAQESQRWTTQPAPSRAWWNSSDTYATQRQSGPDGRPSAVRALLLYPMNALVEDQLVRLREALDSPAARTWYDANTSGEPFYFGRYTGRTPVPGTRHTATTDRVKLLRGLLRQADQRHQQLLQRITDGKSEESSRYFLPSMDGAEMRCRWDMQHTAPDILITNYSMLAIALGRDDEDPIFEQTRRWLDDPQNVFTLVVDELHMYRGTAGTEVALLLRRLLHRLGLNERPSQLSIIGTSASINYDTKGRAFLTEFFGRPSTTFAFINTPPREPSDVNLDDYAHTLTSTTTTDLDNLKSALPSSATITDAFRRALTTADGIKPQSLAAVSAKLFPSLTADQAPVALETLFRHLAESTDADPRFRAHYFFRTLQGLWACSDPACNAVDPPYRSETRRVGRIYPAPRFTCTCGSRVLELLYCESCGETMLGGYVARSGPREFLLSTVSDLENVPDRINSSRNAYSYRVYWPTSRQPVVRASWNRTGRKTANDPQAPAYTMGFRKVQYRPGTGALRAQTGNTATGYVFTVTCSNVADGPARIPAMPTKCPSCGDDQERDWLGKPEDAQRSRSPIRTQGVGFDRANQVLTGTLKRGLESRLVTFSDSRQGAARVAANLELAHYLDLVRALVLDQVAGSNSQRTAIDAWLTGDRTPETVAVWKYFKSQDAQAAAAYVARRDGEDLDASENDAIARADLQLAGTPTLVDLVGALEPRLLTLGVNLAGPAKSKQRTDDQTSHHWKTCFNWAVSPPTDRGAALDSGQRTLLEQMRAYLGEQLVRTAFAAGDRDIESLGLAHAVPATPFHAVGMSDDLAQQFACSALRILLRARRTTWTAESKTNWPKTARDFATSFADRNGTQAGDNLLDLLGSHLGAGLTTGYLFSPDRIRIKATNATTRWRCQSCRTTHLHPSGNCCIACGRPVTEEANHANAASSGELSAGPPENYYAWLARRPDGLTRLHCEELSGQTDPLEAQARQAQFQDVFLDESEVDTVDGIDVLSVTTTMEAGVDIGALLGVVMANMPPQRFNYQQRVGRAGRRGNRLAIALTVCRGARSHDEHYFAHPEAITGDLPPQPFLDTRSNPIITRSFAAAVLVGVFRQLVTNVEGFDPGRSVHGQFGATSEWTANSLLRATAQQWLDDNTAQLESTAAALLAETRSTLTPANLVEYAQTALLAEVTTTAQKASRPELAEALSMAGVLPMFGFPTQVKVLYTEPPRPGREPSTLDRDADIAISEFAPGSEVVKDKAIHTAVGVVDYLRMPSGAWVEGPDPLGPRFTAGMCGACTHITVNNQTNPAATQCPTCQAVAPIYEQVTVTQPRGYRTSYRPRDYEQLSEPTSRASQPRAAIPAAAPTTLHNTDFLAANAEVLAVNDNGGNLYRFAVGTRTWQGATKITPGLVEAGLVGDPDRARRAGINVQIASTVDPPVAIAARRRTDVLTVGAHDLPAGIRIDPRDPAGRGAWASLGYLLQGAAVRWLDIGPDEIEVGVHPTLKNGDVQAEVFLADSLENGAGYARRLADNMDTLLDLTQEYASNLSSHGNETCDSSCYSCLRDYTNSRWHPVLDWRLAADMTNMLLNEAIEFDRYRSRDERAVTALADDFGYAADLGGALPALQNSSGTTVVFYHPLETTASDANPRVAAMNEVAPGHIRSTTFELIRRPGNVAALLLPT